MRNISHFCEIYNLHLKVVRMGRLGWVAALALDNGHTAHWNTVDGVGPSKGVKMWSDYQPTTLEAIESLDNLCQTFVLI